MVADGTDPRLLIDNLSPDVPAGTPAWFSYYGLISWSGVLDFWRPPRLVPRQSHAAAT